MPPSLCSTLCSFDILFVLTRAHPLLASRLEISSECRSLLRAVETRRLSSRTTCALTKNVLLRGSSRTRAFLFPFRRPNAPFLCPVVFCSALLCFVPRLLALLLYVCISPSSHFSSSSFFPVLSLLCGWMMKSADSGGMDALLVLAELHLFGLRGTLRRHYCTAWELRSDVVNVASAFLLCLSRRYF